MFRAASLVRGLAAASAPRLGRVARPTQMVFRTATGGKRSEQEPEPSKGVFGTFMDEVKKGVAEQKELAEAADKVAKAADGAKKSAEKAAEAAYSRASKVSDEVEGSETLKSTQEAMDQSKKSVSDGLGKMMSGLSEGLEGAKQSSAAQASAESVKQARRALDDASKSGPYKVIKDATDIAYEELLANDFAALKASPYKAPADRRRSVLEKRSRREKTFVAANEDVSSLVIKEQSAWEKRWNSFVEDNPVSNKIDDIKIQWEESDNFIARRSRETAEALSDAVGGTFEDGEMGYVYEEIRKVDPKWSEMDFTLHCERVIFPAILEGFMAGDKAVLKDWCTEACYNMLGSNIDHRKESGQRLEYRVLDLRGVELHAAKMMDDQPVFIMVFQATINQTVRNKQGEIIDGADDEVKKVHYVCAMRRDPEEFDPLLAWSAHEFGQIAEAKMLV